MRELIARRFFLSQATGVIGGLSLIRPSAADAQMLELMIAAMEWLGEYVLNEWLRSADLFNVRKDGSFHDSFNSDVAFDRPFNAQPTQWNGYLGVNRFPSLCHSQNLTKEGELNLDEINGLRDNSNPNLYDHGQLRLAPIPNGLRSYPTQQDLQTVGKDMIRCRRNPQGYRVQYARGFCDCSGVSLRGFHWSHASGTKGFRILQV
jgi:hypothetical protein